MIMFWGHKKTDLIKELAMEIPENEGEEYEGHCDDCTGTPTYCGKKLVYSMKMVGLKVTLNTMTKIFVNIIFHSTMALRTILVKTILT